MINTLSINGKPGYGIKEYVCNSVADIQNLPTQHEELGSTCLVIETKEVYIFNGTNWELLK